MKRISVVLLCLLLVLGMVGCNQPKESSPKESEISSENIVQNDVETSKDTMDSEIGQSEVQETETPSQEQTDEQPKEPTTANGDGQIVPEEFVVGPSIIPYLEIGTYIPYFWINYKYTPYYVELYENKIIIYDPYGTCTFTMDDLKENPDEKNYVFEKENSVFKVSNGEIIYERKVSDTETAVIDKHGRFFPFFKRHVINGFLSFELPKDLDQGGEWGCVPAIDEVKKYLLADTTGDYLIEYTYVDEDPEYGLYATYICTNYDENGYGYQPVTVDIYETEEAAKLANENSKTYMERDKNILYFDARKKVPGPQDWLPKEYRVYGVSSYIDELGGRYYYSKSASAETAEKLNEMSALIMDKNASYALGDPKNESGYFQLAGDAYRLEVAMYEQSIPYMLQKTTNMVDVKDGKIYAILPQEDANWNPQYFFVEIIFEGEKMTVNVDVYDQPITFENYENFGPVDSFTINPVEYDLEGGGQG